MTWNVMIDPEKDCTWLRLARWLKMHFETMRNYGIMCKVKSQSSSVEKNEKCIKDCIIAQNWCTRISWWRSDCFSSKWSFTRFPQLISSLIWFYEIMSSLDKWRYKRLMWLVIIFFVISWYFHKHFEISQAHICEMKTKKKFLNSSRVRSHLYKKRWAFTPFIFLSRRQSYKFFAQQSHLSSFSFSSLSQRSREVRCHFSSIWLLIHGRRKNRKEQNSTR